MTKKTAAWVITSALFACSAVGGLVACSSSDDNTDNNGGDAPRPDSGSGTDATVKGDTGTVTPGTDSGGGSSDAGAAGDCGDPKYYPKVRSNAEAGIYCPFRPAAIEAGAAPNCATGEHCCLTPKNTSPTTCTAGGVECVGIDAGTTDWQCGENNDCPASSVCCYLGEPVINATCPGDNFAKNAKGSTCRAAAQGCSAGEYQLCGSQAECPANKTCTAFTSKSIDLGACL